MRFKRTGLAAMAAVAAFALYGCGGGDSGGDKPVDPQEPPTTTIPPVEVPTGTSPITLTDKTDPAKFAALAPKIKVGRVTISSPPVVDFSITDIDGNAIIGFGSASKSATATVASYPNLSFALAKLVPTSNGSPSKWVSYIVTTVPTTTAAATATRPSTDNTGTLVDHKNGTYTYTFYRDVTKVKAEVDAMTLTGANKKEDLGDLSYNAALTHRLTIQVSGNAPGTGTNTPDGVSVTTGVPMANPVNVIYDFVPSTGKEVTGSSGRDVVANEKCLACHSTLGGLVGDTAGSSGAAFHGSTRNDVRYCMVCHTDQRKFGRTEATMDAATLTFTSGTNVVDGRTVGDMPNHIHKAHMGGLLAKKNYNYGGVVYNEVGFPQDIRNCTNCHDGTEGAANKTAQGDNWKNQPSRLACGACHDGINFNTGKGVTIADAAAGLTVSQKGHVGGVKTDAQCAYCHDSADIQLNHLPVQAPSSATGAALAGYNSSRLPAGAIKVSYDIKSFALNAARNPVMVFRMLQNGVAKPFNAYDPASTSPALWDGFRGSVNLAYAYGVKGTAGTQNIAEPADFTQNATSVSLANVWSGTGGTLAGPDADGYYTATLTNTVPAGATVLTGAMGLSSSLIQISTDDYPGTADKTPGGTGTGNAGTGGLQVIAPIVTKVASGFTGRRQIVDNERCNACHENLGLFSFKGGDTFHGGTRNNGEICAFCHNPNNQAQGWTGDSTSFIHATHATAKRSVKFVWENLGDARYPGVLRNCEQCHRPGTYDFSGAQGAVVEAGTKPYRVVITGAAPAASVATSPPYDWYPALVGAGPGTNGSYNTDNLVNSPTAAACFSCHDTNKNKQHMENEGGSIYVKRSLAEAKVEMCDLCHGPGKVADIKTMHARK
jgi:OmcA/MtrC family decaheme c-type cytochrome